jgi:hypothetical protein
MKEKQNERDQVTNSSNKITPLSTQEKDRLYLKETFGLTDQEIEDLGKDDSQRLSHSAFQKPQEVTPFSTLEGQRRYLRETFGLSDQEIAELERQYLKEKTARQAKLKRIRGRDVTHLYLGKAFQILGTSMPKPKAPQNQNTDNSQTPPVKDACTSKVVLRESKDLNASGETQELKEEKPSETTSQNTKRSRIRDVTQEGRAFQIIGTSIPKPKAPQDDTPPVKKGDQA